MNVTEYLSMRQGVKRVEDLLEPRKADADANPDPRTSLRYRLARTLLRLAVRLEPGFLRAYEKAF